MNTSSVHFLADFLPAYPGAGWDATATFLITTDNGATIDGVVVGGSVCELSYPVSCPGSTNEWLTSITIHGGTEKFKNASGTALMLTIFNSAPGGEGFIFNEIFLHLDK